MNEAKLKKEVVFLKRKLLLEKARRISIYFLRNISFYKHLMLLLWARIRNAFVITESDVYYFWYSRETDKIMKGDFCEFCGKPKTCTITRIMQPSWPHDSCDECSKKIGYMKIK